MRNLQFEVEDSGPGMAVEELEYLFEAFTQTSTGQQSSERASHEALFQSAENRRYSVPQGFTLNVVDLSIPSPGNQFPVSKLKDAEATCPSTLSWL